MKCKALGLIVALIAAGTPALAAVDATHDPRRESSSPSASVSYERILDVLSQNVERSLPLECRGYYVSGKSRRESATRSSNRCE
jgi:hypothetical protein